MLECRNIFKNYNGEQILKDISIKIKPGNLNTIVGPSGSGKSTLFRILSQIERQSSGKIFLNGSEVRENFEETDYWPKVSMVFQHYHLWPHLTNLQNIKLAFEDNKNCKFDEDYFSELKSILEITDKELNKYPYQISSGQQQRIAIIRTLILKPKYLLLDEITSSLDVELINKLLDHLIELKNQDRAILLVTHLLGFAIKASDQLLFLDNGHILMRGSPHELVTSDIKRINSFFKNHL